MNKTLIVAATLLSLGAGAAFANDGDVFALPAQVSTQAATAQTSAQHRLFPASNRQQSNVYSMFPAPGNTQEAAR